MQTLIQRSWKYPLGWQREVQLVFIFEYCSLWYLFSTDKHTTIISVTAITLTSHLIFIYFIIIYLSKLYFILFWPFNDKFTQVVPNKEFYFPFSSYPLMSILYIDPSKILEIMKDIIFLAFRHFYSISLHLMIIIT